MIIVDDGRNEVLDIDFNEGLFNKFVELNDDFVSFESVVFV